MWEGADFKLKASQVGGFQNYEKSEFAEPKELFVGDDAKKEATWEKEYPLLPFVADDQFKSYEAIENRFKKVVLGEGNTRTAADAIKAETVTVADAVEAAEAVGVDFAKMSAARKAEKAAKPKTPKAEAVVVAPAPVVEPESTEDESSEEEIAAFFSEVLQEKD